MSTRGVYSCPVTSSCPVARRRGALLGTTALIAVTVLLTLGAGSAAGQAAGGQGAAGQPAAGQGAAGAAGDAAATIPRLANGRPDFNGVWERPYVPDMTRDGRNQKGAGPLPYSDAGRANVEAYNPEDGEYTAMCMPFGLTRSFNSPYPVQIMQNDRYIAFLFEQNTWFHVVPFRDAHPEDLNPTWFGTSIAQWDGDTLVVDTRGFNGFTRLDTRGNPHSDQLRVVQTFRHLDETRVAYTVTIHDPVYYTQPFSNERTFTRSAGDLIEYSCEENNRALWEGRLKLWIPPTATPPRDLEGLTPLGQ